MSTVDGAVGDPGVVLLGGADDYIAKPFDLREVRARLKSVLRRLAPKAAAGRPMRRARILVGRCLLDLDAHQLSDPAGCEVALTSMEFDLLKALVEHPNQVLSRDRLLSLTRKREWEPFEIGLRPRLSAATVTAHRHEDCAREDQDDGSSLHVSGLRSTFELRPL